MALSRPRQPKKVINRKALLVLPRDGTNLASIRTSSPLNSTTIDLPRSLLVPQQASLPALPSELLQEVFSYFDDVSSVCLSLTSRRFYAQYHQQLQHGVVPLWRGYWEQTGQGTWTVTPLRQPIGGWIEDGGRYYYFVPRMKFVSTERKSLEW